jgi:hypothetical protein
MKPINFINPFPPDKQRALHQWYRFSFICIVIFFCIIIFLQGYQFYTWYNVYNEKIALKNTMIIIEKSMCKQNILQKKKQHLGEKLAFLHDIVNKQNRIFTFLSLLQQSNIVLHNILYEDNTFKISCTFPTPNDIQTYMHTISSAPYDLKTNILQLKKEKSNLYAVIHVIFVS